MFRQHLTYEAVTVTQCEINPIGTLQELCITNGWGRAFYSFQQLNILHKDKQYTGSLRATVSYKVLCQIYHL